jgi:hypothetical protein
MTVTSKNKRLAGSEQELLAIGRELISAQQPSIKNQKANMKETV